VVKFDELRICIRLKKPGSGSADTKKLADTQVFFLVWSPGSGFNFSLLLSEHNVAEFRFIFLRHFRQPPDLKILTKRKLVNTKMGGVQPVLPKTTKIILLGLLSIRL
jgi:hypothetical protein